MKFACEDFIFVVSPVANSVGTKLEFAAFCSHPDAKYSTASAFWGGTDTFSQEKHQHVHVDRHLVTEKEISSKINLKQIVPAFVT